MDRDPAEDQIEELLRQPMGDVARGAAWTLLQRYRAAALAAAREGRTAEEREAAVRLLRARLLEDLGEILPALIQRERQCDEAVQEAEERARRAYRERFEYEVSVILADPAFGRPAAERITTAELHTFHKELERELAELIAYHRKRLRDSVERMLEE
jgi:hypothetical protein